MACWISGSASNGTTMRTMSPGSARPKGVRPPFCATAASDCGIISSSELGFFLLLSVARRLYSAMSISCA
ncbi:MAG: hypothetical protein ACKVHQ_05530 [Gammaproteobacteria bacterium]